MKTELKEVLENYNERIEREENKIEKMESEKLFCEAHNLNEEFRITDVQYQASHMIVYRFREMYNEIKSILDKE